VKQPIDGIVGSKPRVGNIDGNGKIDRAEARQLDLEYRRRRNETLRLKNRREELMLRKLSDEWVELAVIHQQHRVLLNALRCRIETIHRSWLARLEACGGDRQKLIIALQDLEHELLLALSRIPEDLQTPNGHSAAEPKATEPAKHPSASERARAAAATRKVTSLQSFEGRANKERSIVEVLKKKIPLR
jgi:hypothetical protein